MRDFVAIFRAMNGIAFAHPSPSGLQKTGAVQRKKWGKNWALVRSMFLSWHLITCLLFCSASVVPRKGLTNQKW